MAKKVAIAGFAAEGKANFSYWSKLGADITIVDENESVEGLPSNVPTIIGEGAFEKLHDFDLVVRTASLNPARIFTHGKIWSATNEFFAKCPAPIIGVTGTKGKGTTCTLIAEILKASGKKVHLVGNIGQPALDELAKIKADDIVVFELSSFQLWDLVKSPETAVVLMITPDHLNVHADMKEYVNAKANIANHQTAKDTLVYHPTNEFCEEIARQSKAKKQKYMTTEGAYVVDGKIVIDDETICSVDEVGLLGEHNLENICAAITASWNYAKNVKATKKAIMTFKGLPHRLEYVREIGGVTYINDSFSTGPTSTIAAINSFNKPLTVIIGGSSKGTDLNELIDSIVMKKPKVVLIGSSTPILSNLLKERGYENFENKSDLKNMQEIVDFVKSNTEKGTVLLSPAHASFDMFKNEFDRGDKFREVVNNL